MNPLEEVATITLSDGKTRELSYSMGSYRRIKKELGKSALKGELASMDEGNLPELLFEGLSAADKAEIGSADALADLIKPSMVSGVMNAFCLAFYEQAIPAPDPNATSSQATAIQ